MLFWHPTTLATPTRNNPSVRGVSSFSATSLEIFPWNQGILFTCRKNFHQDLRNWSLETLTFTSPPPSFTSQLFSGIVNCCTRVIWYFTRVTRYSLGHH